MYASRTITIGIICLLANCQILADSVPTTSTATSTVTAPTQLQQTIQTQTSQTAQIQKLKEQLFTALSIGDVQSGKFDETAEMQIANTQMELANLYLQIGDRKNAAIYALSARKVLQNIYGNPNDPRLIPVYSLLVNIYETDVDSDHPGTDVSDATQAKLYRNLIDHIHAE